MRQNQVAEPIVESQDRQVPAQAAPGSRNANTCANLDLSPNTNVGVLHANASLGEIYSSISEPCHNGAISVPAPEGTGCTGNVQDPSSPQEWLEWASWWA
ncbi:MAG: hypothetical protein AB1758_16275 [Candidatus Eremiobacterota bacterium]